MRDLIEIVQDNTIMAMLATNLIQAIGWAFAFRKRRAENDSGEAAALDSIRDLNNKIAADLKERYDEQAKRISELEERERDSIQERGTMKGKIEVLTQQHLADKASIADLNKKIISYKTEIMGWKTKFESLLRQFEKFKKEVHEK